MSGDESTLPEARKADDEKKRVALARAIRAFTVDMPGGKPNGEAERQIGRLCNLLHPASWPPSAKVSPSALQHIAEANDAAAKMCAAMADDLRALREAAEAFFGEDFGSPPN